MRKRFALGGIAQSNLEQMQNSVVSIKHHVVELGARLKSNPEIPAWVLSKTYRASEYLADITHYLESEMTGKKYCWGGKMADGGSIAAQNLAMEKNITEAIKHHVVELEGMMDKKPEVEGWVIGKLTVAAKDLMDVTHYLEGEAKTFADGGMMAKGGNVSTKEKLIKELQKLQTQLNSSRLSTYKDGDNSEEEISRQIERKAKLDRFNEILEVLKEYDKNMAKGGKVRKKYWIQDALSGDHKGALRETAKRKHLIKGDENLSKADLHKLEKMGGKTARRAYMAETLRKFK